MNDQQPRHVFISYVRENQEQVDRLCQELESHGVKVWLDRDDITAGIFWKDAIRKAIGDGAFFIACFSEEYKDKTITHMNEELNLAIEVLRKRPREQAWFIPVVLSGEVPEWEVFPGKTLQDIQWVALYEHWDAGIQRILSVIKPIPVRIQNLISALRSENTKVRKEAAEALKLIGLEAVPALIEALKDDNTDVSKYAAKALGEIGPEAEAAAPALIETIKYADEDMHVCLYAAKALAKIGSEPKPAFATFIRALKDDNIKVRKEGVQGINLFGLEAVPTLFEALKDDDRKAGKYAAQALWKICEKAESAVPTLIENLKDENKRVRSHAAFLLGRIGPETKAAVPDLIETLKDEDKDVRRAAAWTLGNIGPDAKAAVPALIEALEDSYERLSFTAAESLVQIGLEFNAAIPLLIESLPTLIEALNYESQYFRKRAAYALEKIGPKAKAAVPNLIKLLKNEKEEKDVRQAAAKALKKINTPEARKTLKEYKQKFK